MATKSPSRPLMEVRNLRKEYPLPGGSSRLVLGGVDFTVDAGQFVCIVGPSGAGKTTLLRCLSGLTAPSTGTVSVAGTVVTAPPSQLAVVFQDYGRSLMPWLTVQQNIELPLRSRKLPSAVRRRKALEMISAVGLPAHAASQHPWQLSGGMQQRVAIARALACESEILLMDEPFASVDAQTRSELEDLVLQIRKEFGVTVLLVTHDIDEAVYLSDEVIVLSGSPSTVQQRIAVPFGEDRDQIATKLLPEFASLRADVLTLIARPLAKEGASRAL